MSQWGINCYAFQWEFFEIYYNDLKTFDELVKKVSRYGIDSEMNFHTDLKIKNFSSLVSDNLLPICEFLDEGPSEQGFYRKLKQVYSKILDLEYGESDREVLKFVMILFTLLTSLAYSLLSPTIFNST